MSWKLTWQGMETTMRLTAMVVFILLGARVFSLVFQGVGGKEWIEGWLVSLPGGVVGFLIFVNIFVFLIAFFLDFFEIAFIIVPLLVPAAEALGINIVWFGVLLGANMQTAFMHPPFGFALFYLRGIAPPTVRTRDIYWGAIPWLCLQLVLVGILIAFPEIVTSFLTVEQEVDLEHFQLDAPTAAPGGFAPPSLDLGSPPSLGAPAAPDLSQPPSLGPPAAPDLSQPPKLTP
jgi:TRAP-type mannitol/chloroaromatic compound transport system permease large subunit